MKSVLDQVAGCFVPAEDLAPAARCYNASIAKFEGRRLIAYRQEQAEHLRSRLRIAELHVDDGLDDLPIEIPGLRPELDSLEDPRLFHHAGALWLAWTCACYEGPEWACRQFYGRLESTGESWRVPEPIAPRYGRNDGTAREKNWQFFSACDGRLFAQYSPSHVIELQGDRIVRDWKEKPLAWNWGKPSGGTPPVPFAPGQLITFFHAFDFDHVHARRYNFAALVFEDRPPFRRVACSAVPLVTASEADPLPEGKTWQPLCIFPCGAVFDGTGWIVSAGVNDERIALLNIPRARLMLDNFDRRNLPPEVTVEVVAPIVLRGDIVLPPETPTLPRTTAIELLNRRKVVLIPQPA